MLISDKVVRNAGRDIIYVIRQDNSRQGMYRSSGHNSGMQGTWLPFDGIVNNGNWFNKRRYCIPFVLPEFQRFGNLKWLSDQLSQMEIPKGMAISWREVNIFLGSAFYELEE